MSDFYDNNNNNTTNNSENSYNYSSYGNYNEYKSEENPQPKKPKKHTFLKVIAFLLCMGIAGGGSVQIYKFMNNTKLSTPSEEETSETSETPENTADSDETPEKTNDSASEQKVPAPQNLPGLFDIASRTDAKYLPDIVDEIMPSVVGVSSTFEFTSSGYSSWGFGFGIPQEPTTQEAVGTGTGIVMSEDGYIVTNAHVIYDDSEYKAGEAKSVSVLFSDKKEYDAKIIAYDLETDIAVLKIDETGFTPATFGDSDDLRVGELVIAVGNPLGFELFGSVTSGIVSALNREISINEKNMTLIQTDAAINSGNSGGPLLNSCGQVIGINSAKMSSSYGSNTASIEGLGFAIPINDARVIIDDLINNGHVTGRPQIGITAVDIDEMYSSYLGLPMGIYVRNVAEGSAAEMAGIKVGDVIIGINDEAVTSMDELNSIKNKFKAGDTITLKISRNGEDIDIDLVLHDANDEMNVQEEN